MTDNDSVTVQDTVITMPYIVQLARDCDKYLKSFEALVCAKQLNRQWLLSQNGKNSYLAQCADLYGEEFVRTSCETTANMLRMNLVPGVDDISGWHLLDDDATIASDVSIFQISLGDEWSDVQHIVTFAHGYLFDSWFKQYSLRAIACERNLLVSRTTAITALYNMLPKLANTWKVFYWIPIQKK
jgi:hypothetical protein